MSVGLRQRILLAVECPDCGTKGAAEYEQDEPSPGDGSRHERELLSVRGAFVIGLAHPPAVHCAHCHAKAV
jgi:uncharacterized OB-fold protein